MPIYVFRCPQCLAEVEVIQAFSTAAPVCRNAVCEEFAVGEPGVVTMERVPAVSYWQWGEGPKESNISSAIKRVKAAEQRKR